MIPASRRLPGSCQTPTVSVPPSTGAGVGEGVGADGLHPATPRSAAPTAAVTTRFMPAVPASNPTDATRMAAWPCGNARHSPREAATVQTSAPAGDPPSAVAWYASSAPILGNG